MNRIERDEEREARIENEIIVDAYDPEEQVIGWYYYLDDRVDFPFFARCIEEKRAAPLKLNETVEVIGMASEDECMNEMFVEIKGRGRDFAVPLAQLEPIKVDNITQQAIADWHYWVKRGYQLC